MRSVFVLIAALLVGCGPSKLDIEKEGGVQLVYEMQNGSKLAGPAADSAADDAVKVIDARLRELELRKFNVRRRGTDIVVDLPGMKDPAQMERIKRIIGTGANLEFRIVDDAGSEQLFKGLFDGLPSGGQVRMLREDASSLDRRIMSYYLEAEDDPATGRTGEQLLQEVLKTVAIPQGRKIAFERTDAMIDLGNPAGGVTWRTYYLDTGSGFTGDHVANASVRNDEQTGQPYVLLEFDQAGAQLFEKVTGDNVRRRLAIVLDDRVNSAPLIMEKIPGGSCRITLGGYRSYKEIRSEAQDLALVLKSGALPAKLFLTVERTVAAP